MKDQWNAFVQDDIRIKPTRKGPLDCLTFAVKDVFEMENHRNTAGNPDWYRTHTPATRNASAVAELLQNGAELLGAVQTDEIMFSLDGENFHYGTPINPCDSNRIPGGSSSGSAVAVASGLVDFALGTDTGGSVRIPSSYCGLYGFRPTYGIVKIDGVIPLAKSFDTVGWMTRNPKLLADIGEVLIKEDSKPQPDFRFLFFEEEAWSFLDGKSRATLSRAVSHLKKMGNQSKSIGISENGLSEWADIFRTIQGIEIWEEHREWIETFQPTFGSGIKERFEWTSTLNREQLQEKQKQKEEISHYLSLLLEENGLLILPTAPGEAPLLNRTVAEMEQYRSKVMRLTCIAGLSGFPQVTMPFRIESGAPIGLSIIANRNQDLSLLRWIIQFLSELNGGNQ